MRISIIVAVTTNGVIGRDGDLPWHLSTDLKRFKAMTTGHHLIMGRKTFDSVGKPLPGRVNVVVTRDASCRIDGAVVVNSVEDAFRVAEEAGETEAFVGGGAEIFAQTLHRADRMYVTRIHTELVGDTFFPEFDDVGEWRLDDTEHFEADGKNDYPFSFLLYERTGGEGHAIPPEG